jgi:hypothetical protein
LGTPFSEKRETDEVVNPVTADMIDNYGL